ncbi:tyrosine-type recombinase/integrase [Mesorhizobium sp. M0142]|uniref:tyrosine-type recombinase/integrase n=1 Tax=Mesorhizobium sp. M0142 TaxID=2956894 RepID=UPI0033395239
MTAFIRFLGEKAERYIELRHSLGYSFSKQAGTLRAFVRYVERAQFDAPATRTMALDFVLSFGGAANSRTTRHGVLRRFYEYLAVYDAQTETLERRVFPRSRAIPPPRILSESELASLIAAKANHRDRRSSWPPEHQHNGHRPPPERDAWRNARTCVVDLTSGVLLVRKTKFRKDRLVPVHTTTQAALRHYARERDAAFPTPKDQGFFLSSRDNRLSATGLQNGFAEVRKLAGLDGGKPLRPHDLRHRFAVTRLSFWHRQRADCAATIKVRLSVDSAAGCDEGRA